MSFLTTIIVLAIFYGTGAIIKYNDEDKCPDCVESFED